MAERHGMINPPRISIFPAKHRPYATPAHTSSDGQTKPSPPHTLACCSRELDRQLVARGAPASMRQAMAAQRLGSPTPLRAIPPRPPERRRLDPRRIPQGVPAGHALRGGAGGAERGWGGGDCEEAKVVITASRNPAGTAGTVSSPRLRRCAGTLPTRRAVCPGRW